MAAGTGVPMLTVDYHAGVPTEFHVYPGCPHGFETVAPDAAVSQRATPNRMRRLRNL
jgi:hypothetical protein